MERENLLLGQELNRCLKRLQGLTDEEKKEVVQTIVEHDEVAVKAFKALLWAYAE